MENTKEQLQLIKTKYGFYQYHPLPSDEELQEYYADKYYQQGLGSYSVSYTDEEIEYFKIKALLIYLKTSQLIDMSKKRAFMDIGCGEGWVLNEFNKQGHIVEGIDFSKHGILKFHPHLLDNFEQGNIYELLDRKIADGEKFDVLLLANVIEHVIEPVDLLEKIKNIMLPDSLIVIIAPNDFSPLHEYLLENGFITKKFWLCYPDHISYFNKENMTTFLAEMGFNLRSVVADNPIDLNLLNDNSNYIEDIQKGKNTHYYRVRSDNFLASLDRVKLLELYEVLGSMGVGRELNYYCCLAK